MYDEGVSGYATRTTTPGATIVAAVGSTTGARKQPIAAGDCSHGEAAIGRGPIGAWLRTVIARRKHRQDLRQPPHRDNPLQRPVATRFGKLPRIDQDVGLPGGDHPLGALRERDVVVVPIGKSDAGDPPRARRDTDRASDRGAQDTRSMPAQNVGRRGRRCGRIEPGSVAAAIILTELVVGGACSRVDDSYDDAVTIQSVPPADGSQRPTVDR